MFEGPDTVGFVPDPGPPPATGRVMLDTGNWANVHVAAGYGGIRIATPVAGVIDATWTTVTGWDAATYAVPRGVVQDFANNGLTLNSPGAWQAVLMLALAFTESNGSRRIQVRAFDELLGIGGDPRPAFIARNQDGTNISLVIPSDVTAAAEGNTVTIQLRSDDTFAAVQVEGEFSVSHISEYKGG